MWNLNRCGSSRANPQPSSWPSGFTTHDPSLHPDAPLLVDVDLSILGKSPAQFEDYETSIRREYAWVPQQTFAEKRVEILKRFLARKRIYSTEAMFTRYERQARENLAESIRKLKGLDYAG